MIETIEFLDLVWGEEDCFVDLPSKAGGHWIPWYTQWPADRVLVRGRLESCVQDGEDIYFSVARFGSRGRRLSDVLPSSWLWADLDQVDPVFLDQEALLPSVAWESSPGRYQCLWRLTRELPPETQTKLNARLSRILGADPGGWDLTQVLRPVGTKNFKYDPVPDVTLLWYDEEVTYEPREIRDAIWRVEEEEAAADGDGRPGARLVRSASDTSPSTASLPARARRLLRTPPEMVVVGERSARLWELERILADSGLGEEEIFDLVWPTAWNKHREVRTGEERLRKEIKKAIAQAPKKRTTKPKAPTKTEVVRERTDRSDGSEAVLSGGTTQRARVVSPFVPYATFLSTNIETPRWLIDGVWSAASHGIVGGEPKTSKSTFCLAMALSVATGSPFLGEYQVATPGPVLVVQEENSPWFVQDRLRKLAKFYKLLGKEDIEVSVAPLGAMTEHVIRLNFPDEAPLHLLNNYGFNLTEDEDREMLEREVRRTGAVMVILDPLYLVLLGVKLNQSEDVGPFLQWLMALRHNHNCAVVLVHHWSKSSENTRGRRSGQRLLGSTFFHGWLESGLYMERLDEVDATNPLMRIKVEREFRNVAPRPDLEVAWQLGEPGELDLKVNVTEWNQAGLVESTIEQLLANVDKRGLNLKHVATQLDIEPTPEGRAKVAKLARAAGYDVKRVKYPRGYGYVIFPDRNGSSDD